jgi:phosphate transport system ATP-binding protein
MAANTHISVKDLNVHYGKLHVLKGISIDIPDKQITAIIGPSGCGKTTLLRTFNRLLEANEEVKITGQVLVDGVNIYDPKAEITEIRKKMGLLAQKPFPLPMSIYDNIAFGMKLHASENKSEMENKVEYFLTQAGLWEEVKDRLNDPAGKLSIGQQQRLCLARGLAVKPEIILGDEPTSALDPVSSQHIEDKFGELKSDYTIVLVTHLLRQARKLADHVIFIYLGEIIEYGPATEFFENPKEKLTQDYIKGTFF